MNERTVQRLRDALRAAEAVPEFLAGATLEEYKANFGLRLQIERLLEIVGEALNQARKDGDAEAIGTKVPEVGAIIGLRNRITHGYDQIDDEILWDAATNSILTLTEQLKGLLESLE